MTRSTNRSQIEDFLDGVSPYNRPYGNVESADQIARIAGVLKDSHRRIKLVGILKSSGIPDHSYSIEALVKDYFRDVLSLCEEFGELPKSEDEQVTARNLQKIVFWAVNEMGAVFLSGNRILTSEVTPLEETVNSRNSPISIGVRNGMFYNESPKIASKYILAPNESVDLSALSDAEILQKIYEVSTIDSPPAHAEFYRKLFLGPMKDEFNMLIDFGQGERVINMRKVVVYYIFTAHAATKLREIDPQVIENAAKEIIKFIGFPQRNLSTSLRHMKTSMRAYSSPELVNALHMCYDRSTSGRLPQSDAQ